MLKASPELSYALYNDYAAITRVRTFPREDLQKRARRGLGWVPANICITPFGTIASENPFGPTGELRLIPDTSTEAYISAAADSVGGLAYLSDLVGLDGEPWALCTRGLLKQAIKELNEEFGITANIAFEHEFSILGDDSFDTPTGFTFQRLDKFASFIRTVTKSLFDAGIHPEMVIPEYGPNQFEISCQTAGPLKAADQSVILRELVRIIARAQGLRATFAPITNVEEPGNGVHVHISLNNSDGKQVTHITDGKAIDIDVQTSQFVAGIHRALPKATALLAPSPLSYKRLQPGHWSTASAAVGYCNRETAIRLCPGTKMDELDSAETSNFEVRVPDASASPHVVLAVLLRAGMNGIREKLNMHTPLRGDPQTVDENTRTEYGMMRLPEDLPQALALLDSDEHGGSLLPDSVVHLYRVLKYAELGACAGIPEETLCQKYRSLY